MKPYARPQVATKCENEPRPIFFVSDLRAPSVHVCLVCFSPPCDFSFSQSSRGCCWSWSCKPFEMCKTPGFSRSWESTIIWYVDYVERHRRISSRLEDICCPRRQSSGPLGCNAPRFRRKKHKEKSGFIWQTSRYATRRATGPDVPGTCVGRSLGRICVFAIHALFVLGWWYQWNEDSNVLSNLHMYLFSLSSRQCLLYTFYQLSDFLRFRHRPLVFCVPSTYYLVCLGFLMFPLCFWEMM